MDYTHRGWRMSSGETTHSFDYMVRTSDTEIRAVIFYLDFFHPIVSENGRGLWEPTQCAVQIMVKNVCAREKETNVKMSENLQFYTRSEVFFFFLLFSHRIIYRLEFDTFFSRSCIAKRIVSVFGLFFLVGYEKKGIGKKSF